MHPRPDLVEIGPDEWAAYSALAARRPREALLHTRAALEAYEARRNLERAERMRRLAAILASEQRSAA